MCNKVRVSIIALALVLSLPAGMSFANRRDRHEDRHYYHYHDHPRYGLQVPFIPDDCYAVRADRSRYYYYDGLYYSRRSVDYVLVAPPIGAIVRSVPPDYQAVVINGVTYYTDNGTYYIYTRNGYQVVLRPAPSVPVVAVQPAPAVTAQPVPDDPFTVNVPNDKGGYTPVVIKRSGNGFTGPQGEFYPEFPKVAQLKSMYGK